MNKTGYLKTGLDEMSDKNFSVEELNQHLNSLLALDPDTAMNMIYNTVVGWAHRTYKDVGEYETAYDRFMSQTRSVIRCKASGFSRQKVSSFHRKEVRPPPAIATELLSLLRPLPSENAIGLLSELTAAWCLSCPREQARQYFENENLSDIEVAEGLFSWLLRPFDFF